jgi:opacity protein-like surface antigen
MRKLIPALLVAAVFLIVLPVRAQSSPEWEVFGGYSYLHINPGTLEIPPFAFGSFPTSDFLIPLNQNFDGWHASVAQNVNSWFGAVADFNGDYANRIVDFTPVGGPKVRVNLQAYPVLFGPQFSYRKLGPVSIFGHGMMGIGYARASYAGSDGAVYSETHWAYAFGGGADLRISPRVAVRLVQFDWIRTHFPENLALDYQNNWRISAGFVLRVGER